MRFLFAPLLTACLVGSAAAATAQQFPVPEAKNPDWVLQKIESPTGMPSMQVWSVPDRNASTEDAVRGGVYDGETGALVSFYDPRTAIAYDLRHGILHDRTTNKYYRFHRRGAQPQPQPSIKFL
ncbi:hypothetical protein [Hymenobacter psychrophilus]|uniref:S9 family peptidase n=1 Tax=Hymenobacter psychrophilus TaxID=651662 RepID=A0A1H3ECN0_9BACT|nr:hypothetical protein [Hymenobacter psychrophilus]SDX75659.1 hypothetical protein SAMN04488069_10346 [Hymenobacter psychrophilus]